MTSFDVITTLVPSLSVPYGPLSQNSLATLCILHCYKPLGKGGNGGGGGGGGDVAYLKNRDQIINLRMIGRANSEDTRILGELWACSSGKKKLNLRF